MFILPSCRQLCNYMIAVPQDTGLSCEVMSWMLQAAQEHLPLDRYAGVVHDEIYIQEDLVVSQSGSDKHLVGFVDTGHKGNFLCALQSTNPTDTLAKQVWQVYFTGFTGFRFPVAHYGCHNIKVCGMYKLLGDVLMLQDYGFRVYYIMQDGGEQKREFIHLHFKEKDPLSCRYLCPNPTIPTEKVALVQDYAHKTKKMRNAILSSGVDKGFTWLLKKMVT